MWGAKILIYFLFFCLKVIYAIKSNGGSLPAVDDDGAAEQVLEGVHPLAELQQQLGLVGHAVVRPADELDMSHHPLRVLPLLKERNDTRTPSHANDDVRTPLPL